jgi:MFS family permease
MLKLFYVCYFVVVGVSTPFFGPYLRQLGLSGQAVSTILTVAPTLQLGVPMLWGWLADRSQRPHLILRGLCLGACLVSVPVIFVRTMPVLLVLYALQQIFAGSIMALADSVAVEKARVQGFEYARVRLWGSFSFIATCFATGALLDWRALKNGDALVPALVSVAFGLSFLAALGVSGHAGWEAPRFGDVRRLLGDRRFRLLLLVAGLHWHPAPRSRVPGKDDQLRVRRRVVLRNSALRQLRATARALRVEDLARRFVRDLGSALVDSRLHAKYGFGHCDPGLTRPDLRHVLGYLHCVDSRVCSPSAARNGPSSIFNDLGPGGCHWFSFGRGPV